MPRPAVPSFACATSPASSDLAPAPTGAAHRLSRRSLLGAAVLPLAAALVPLAPQASRAADAFSYQERSLGAADAPIEMVEVSSLLCGHCATFHKDTLPILTTEYIDTGKLRLVFRDHSLGHPLALGAAMILRCAPQSTFFPLLSSLFANQRGWSSAPNPLEALKGYAALAGLDSAAVNACLDSEAVFAGIKAGEDWAGAHGVDSTPSFLIDGKPVIVGAQPIEAFRAVLDPLLAN